MAGKMKKELKLYGNKEAKYFLNTRTGNVRKENDFPWSSPGPDFMKQTHREFEVGTIGPEGVEYVIGKIADAALKGITPREGCDGWASDLYPFWNNSETELSPGKKR